MNKTEYLVEYSLSSNPELVKKITILWLSSTGVDDLKRLVNNMVSQISSIPPGVGINIISYAEKKREDRMNVVGSMSQVSYIVSYEIYAGKELLSSGNIRVNAQYWALLENIERSAISTIQTMSDRGDEIRIIKIS